MIMKDRFCDIIFLSLSLFSFVVSEEELDTYTQKLLS